MLRHVMRRAGAAVPLLFIVSVMMFVLVDLAPGDAARTLAGENPTPERVAEIRELLGLDQPLPVRYGQWLGDAVRGDLGTSLYTRQPVSAMVGQRLSVTLSLVGVSLLFTVTLAMVFGVLASLRPGGLADRVITAAASVGIAIPPFWLGLMLMVALAVNRPWLPAIGYAGLAEGWTIWLRHLLLPGFALSLFQASELTLQLKNSLTETLDKPFVLAAKARGLGPSRVVFKHGLKNAAVPVLTVLGFRLAALLGGTVTIETVFVLPGLGTLAVASVLGRDVPVLLGLVLVSALLVVLINLVVDLSYGYFNPKVRA